MSKYNIERFLEPQNSGGYGSFERALQEIRQGRKETHWIWYIFPQHVALGRSAMNSKYGITCLEEAKEYMEEATLRAHLIEICEALLTLPTDDPVEVFGIPDAYKMRSCVTLFREAVPECEVFSKVLDKYCQGEPCQRTMELLGR